jgi:hypothetical protein
MHLTRLSLRRLIGVGLLATAAAATPVVTLLTASPPAPAGAAVTSCSTAGLVIWLNTEGNGTAGSVYYTLEFTNVSGHECSIYAFPGVSAVNLAGRQLGSAAHYTNGAKRPIADLANGDTATAIVQVVDTGVFGRAKCAEVRAAGLRVYPPDQYTSKVVPFPFLACSRPGPIYLLVQPVKESLFGWS